MGQMKWVYSLAQNGRLEEYMQVYYKNLGKNCAGFTYNGKFLTMVRAAAVLKLLKDADKQYQEHIDQQAEMLIDGYTDMQYLEQ
jgi:hypothetical protein|tara:strand:+ start:299 stop:550 length:252 start_codon:yes stop_codon:yes gene_type:complete